MSEDLDHGELAGHLQSMEEMLQQSAQLLLTQCQQTADLASLTASFGSGIPPHSSFSLFVLVPFPLTSDLSEPCPEVIDTYSEDTIEFVGPDSSALFGAGTSVTEPHTSLVDDTEAWLEQGEQVADVLPLG